jgi:hypothetical protein
MREEETKEAMGCFDGSINRKTLIFQHVLPEVDGVVDVGSHSKYNSA